MMQVTKTNTAFVNDAIVNALEQSTNVREIRRYSYKIMSMFPTDIEVETTERLQHLIKNLVDVSIAFGQSIEKL